MIRVSIVLEGQWKLGDSFLIINLKNFISIMISFCMKSQIDEKIIENAYRLLEDSFVTFGKKVDKILENPPFLFWLEVVLIS